MLIPKISQITKSNRPGFDPGETFTKPGPPAKTTTRLRMRTSMPLSTTWDRWFLKWWFFGPFEKMKTNKTLSSVEISFWRKYGKNGMPFKLGGQPTVPRSCSATAIKLFFFWQEDRGSKHKAWSNCDMSWTKGIRKVWSFSIHVPNVLIKLFWMKLAFKTSWWRWDPQ